MQNNASFWTSLDFFLRYADIGSDTPSMIKDTYWRLRKVVDAEMAYLSREYNEIEKDGYRPEDS